MVLHIDDHLMTGQADEATEPPLDAVVELDRELGRMYSGV